MYGRRNSQPILLLIIFIALELILSFIPATHWLDLGALLPATLTHLPVVLAGALLGSGSGALVGLIAGVCRLAAVSLLAQDTLITPLFSFFFLTPDGGTFTLTSGGWIGLLTSLIPPIAAGILAALLYRALGRVLRGNLVSLGLAGGGGTLVGALLMWGGIWANPAYSFNGSFMGAAFMNTGFEVLVAIVACALPGTLLYHKFASHDSY